MLFSHPELAAFLSARFECAWQSLRPVPQVTVDFGDGRVLRRTLHGNVATWFATADGLALDVVPGLIDADGLRRRAEDALELHARLRSEERPLAVLRGYHRARAAVVFALPETFAEAASLVPSEDPLRGEALENARRRAPLAHALLARAAGSPVELLTPELVRTVLGVDLADPWLGLAPLVLGGETGRSVGA